MNIGTRVRNYVAKRPRFSDNGFPAPDDALFLEEGIADSQGVMQLVPLVEEAYGLPVAYEDISSCNFGSVNKLADFVCRKLG
jgi:acyl carrier protein